MTVLRAVWRLLRIFWCVIFFRCRLWVHPVCDSREGALRVHHLCRQVLKILKIDWRTSGHLSKRCAVVANHLSYLDILVFSASRPMMMVAKSEVASWPIFGSITRCAGTVYVVRGGGPATYPGVNRAMAQAFDSGLPVLFFPEGTTTDGGEVLAFRRGLLHSVLQEGVPLYAAAITYSDSAACWFGEATLPPHLFRVACGEGMQSSIRVGHVVPDREDRFVLAECARDAVVALYSEIRRELDTVDGRVDQSQTAETAKNLLDGPVQGLGSFDDEGCVLS